MEATGSYDPDGDNLSSFWFPYPEIGTLDQMVVIEYAENLVRVYVVALDIQKAATTHFVLKLTDNGKPPLSRYRRVNVNVVPR